MTGLGACSAGWQQSCSRQTKFYPRGDSKRLCLTEVEIWDYLKKAILAFANVTISHGSLETMTGLGNSDITDRQIRMLEPSDFDESQLSRVIGSTGFTCFAAITTGTASPISALGQGFLGSTFLTSWCLYY